MQQNIGSSFVCVVQVCYEQLFYKTFGSKSVKLHFLANFACVAGIIREGEREGDCLLTNQNYGPVLSNESGFNNTC